MPSPPKHTANSLHPVIDQSMFSSFLKCRLDNSLILIQAVVLYWIFNYIISSISHSCFMFPLSRYSFNKYLKDISMQVTKSASTWVYDYSTLGRHHKDFASWISHTLGRLSYLLLLSKIKLSTASLLWFHVLFYWFQKIPLIRWECFQLKAKYHNLSFPLASIYWPRRKVNYFM